jgi:hypothetical protein
VAPPLDGIWATAPFLHNGSVPTLEELLDSRTRAPDPGRPGYSNAGHTFGDPLTAADRRALIEFLKTL